MIISCLHVVMNATKLDGTTYCLIAKCITTKVSITYFHTTTTASQQQYSTHIANALLSYYHLMSSFVMLNSVMRQPSATMFSVDFSGDCSRQGSLIGPSSLCL